MIDDYYSAESAISPPNIGGILRGHQEIKNPPDDEVVRPSGKKDVTALKGGVALVTKPKMI